MRRAIMVMFPSRVIMSTVDFEVAYDGEAVRDGTMDVQQLAPALLAVGDLVSQANRVLNGETADVSVRIKTGTEAGSFPVELLLSLDPAAQQDLVHAALTDGAHLLSVLGLVKGADAGLSLINNLLNLLKRIGRGKVEGRKKLDDGSVELTVTGDGNTITLVTNPKVEELANDPKVRKALSGVMEPLRKPGIDEFQVRERGKVVDKVTRPEVGFYEAVPLDSRPMRGDDVIDWGEYERWVRVKKNWNEPGNKFTFEVGENQTISAEVADQNFWELVERDQVPATKHALFRFRFEWEQRLDASGVLRTKTTATKFLGYRPPPLSPEDQQRPLLAPEPPRLPRTDKD